jgi:hypothetical protein
VLDGLEEVERLGDPARDGDELHAVLLGEADFFNQSTTPSRLRVNHAVGNGDSLMW